MSPAWIGAPLIETAERGWIPDAGLRLGIRALLRERARTLAAPDPEARLALQRAFADEMRRSPIALVPERANQQHYEVPAAFFEHVLGPRLKYSACLFPPGVSELAEAEERMLALTAERAGLEDGMRVLDLGCGWGSLALWVAERYPRCRVLAVSNAKGQAQLVERRRQAAGIDPERLRVVTADANHFEPGERFDRVLSVEMFEHLRNWERMLERIGGWLDPDGRLFLHFFCHRECAYPYEDGGPRDWMTRTFFAGGMMPSDGLILEIRSPLAVEARWRVDGRHYQRTCQAWLARLDAARAEVLPILAAAQGRSEAERWMGRWRLFFLACAELFGYRGGREWWVAHVRLAPRRAVQEPPGEASPASSASVRDSSTLRASELARS